MRGDPVLLPAASDADIGALSPYQRRIAEVMGQANRVARFFDNDTWRFESVRGRQDPRRSDVRPAGRRGPPGRRPINRRVRWAVRLSPWA
jgi:hypothetical protein